MGQQVQLQALLENLLGTDHVYFQPPPGLAMGYPCIVYAKNNIRMTYAGNKPYSHMQCYTLTVIDADPNSAIPMKVASLPLCSSDRSFRAANLNHDVFTLYY